MPPKEPENTIPFKDEPTAATQDPRDLFEVDLLELFDRYELPIEQIACVCLHWADRIFTKLGEDSLRHLRNHRDFMRQIDSTYPSTMRLVDHPQKGRFLVTVASISEREFMIFRDWMRLEQHVAALKIEPYRTPMDDPKDD